MDEVLNSDSELYFPPSSIRYAKVLGNGSINGGICTGTVVGIGRGVEISNTYSNAEGTSTTPFIGCATSGTSWINPETSPYAQVAGIVYYGDLEFEIPKAKLMTLSTSDDTPYLSPLTRIENSRFDGAAPLIGREEGDRFFIFNNIFITSALSWRTHADYVEDHNYSNLTDYGTNLGSIEAFNPPTPAPLCLEWDGGITLETPANFCYFTTYYPSLYIYDWDLDSRTIPIPFEQVPEVIPDFYEQNPGYIPTL